MKILGIETSCDPRIIPFCSLELHSGLTEASIAGQAKLTFVYEK
jgi:hypothetical protein